MSADQLFGKFRGTVVNNVDPLQIGRIQAIVPDVSPLVPGTWAMPCFSIAGSEMGVFALPQIGSGVWIEFERGNPDFPIWTGCFYSSAAEAPALALAGNPAGARVVAQTPLQHTISISDQPGPGGGIVLKSAGGATIVVNDAGIFIENGKGASIVLVGPTVTVNAGALEVT